MTPEGKVKQWGERQIEKKYGSLAVWSYAPPGGYFGQNGTMDRLLLVESGEIADRPLYDEFGPPPGVFVAIEYKADGNDLRPLQRRKLEEVYRAGGVAASIIGKDHAKMARIFAEIDKRRAMIRSVWYHVVVRRDPTVDDLAVMCMEVNEIYKDLPWRSS